MLMWPIFAVLASIAWAAVNIGDKKLVTNRFPEFTNYFIIESSWGLLIAIFALLIGGFEGGTIEIMMFGLVTGLLEGGFSLLYFRALKIADVSVVVILLQLIPIFSTLFGVLFFGEFHSPITYFGIFLIVFGTGLASFEKETTKIRKGLLLFFLIGVASLFVSISYVIEVYILGFVSVNSVFILRHVGQALFAGVILLLPRTRQNFLSVVPHISPYILAVSFVLVFLNLVGVYLQTTAYVDGPISIVTVLSSMQPIFVLIAILIFNRLRANFVPDEGTYKYLGIRLIAVLITIVGVALLSIG